MIKYQTDLFEGDAVAAANDVGSLLVFSREHPRRDLGRRRLLLHKLRATILAI